MALGELMSSPFSQSAALISSHSVDFSHEDTDFEARRRDSESASSSCSTAEAATVTTMAYLPQTMVLCEFRHEAFQYGVPTGPADNGVVSKWRLKDRMKTGYVAIVLCLNISVDPPDVIKISPCAKMECWIDPFSMTPQKAIETIGRTLSMQYERWQPRARYKIQRDPTVEEVKKLCTSCRKNAKSERVLFHYNGHGVPRPTSNGEIWLFNKSYTQYIPLQVSDLDSWLGTPSIYVFDCSAAGMIVNAFMELYNWSHYGNDGTARDCILLAACEANETLPQSADFPADVFTSCLTTPIKMALRWFQKRSLLNESFDYSLIDQIPGRQNDRKTPLGELNWIFTAVTDTIAWNVLPRDLFQRLFRQDLLVASLFRNFLLAERIMRSANCSPISRPVLPPAHQHHMWDAWDMAAEICLSQLQPLLDDPNAEFQPSPFFTEQLTAFELSLDHGSEHKKPPEQLPIVLQVLLSQGHRFRALVLLGRFLDMGHWAVDLALSVGIFPYVLKLLQTTTPELRQILVFIWTKILALDKSCQVDLVKDGGHVYFIKFLDSAEAYPEQRAMAAFVLAVIVDAHRRGQEACLEAGLIHVCLKYLQCSTNDAQAEPLFIQWLSLCLAKIWEDFLEAQLVALQENAPAVCVSLVTGHPPEVRASAVFALGTLLDIGFDLCRDSVSGDAGLVDDDEKIKAETGIVKSLLSVVSDGSPLVRTEVAVALSRFAFSHSKHLKATATAYWRSQSTSVVNSIPLFHAKTPAGGQPSTNQYVSHGIGPILRVGSDDIRIPSSSPLRSIMNGSPLSDDSSHHSDSGILNDMLNNGIASHSGSKSKPLDNTLYSQCVLAMCILAMDPFPHVSSLGRRVLSIIGIEHLIAKPTECSDNTSKLGEASSSQPPLFSSLARSSSWFDMNAGHLPIRFRTPPVSPPRPSYLKGLRRVCSLDFRPHVLNSQDAGLAVPCVSASGSSGVSERSFLPQSAVYNWSCTHFSRPLLHVSDEAEEALARREEREKQALNLIAKCQHSSVNKFDNQIAGWDTKFEASIKGTIMQPFYPIVIAANVNEGIRVWNYDEATLLNSFENHSSSENGISKLCLVNELDDSLLLIASGNGNVRIWKEYTQKSQQKLVTAFSSIQGHKPSVRCGNAIIDWQQQAGYLYAVDEMSPIMLWDLDKEQLFKSIPSSSDSSISALSASQVHGGQFAVGLSDGHVRLFDVRTPTMMLFSIPPHQQRVERVVGIGFQPGLESIKLVSACQAGDVQFLDLRNRKVYHTIPAHRGSLTALAVHRHAPVIASGSANQLIKVFNLEGKHLSTIRYYQNFMAQKIGSVSCLAFHPFQPLLAAGAADACVSIYANDAAQIT